MRDWGSAEHFIECPHCSAEQARNERWADFEVFQHVCEKCSKPFEVLCAYRFRTRAVEVENDRYVGDEED